MKFLADENFRADCVQYLRSLGHQVDTVPPATADEDVAELAKRNDFILLTHDKGFAITLKYPPQEFCGILLFRFKKPTFEGISGALKSFLKDKTQEKLRGKTFVITPDSVTELRKPL